MLLADHRKSSSDEDDDHDDSCDEQRNLNSTTNNQGLAPAFVRKTQLNRKKRTGPTTSKEPFSKKRRTDNDSFSIENEDRIDTNQASSISASVLNDFNANLIQIRKQLGCLQSSVDRQQKTLNIIVTNEKKMAKAMRHHQVQK